MRLVSFILSATEILFAVGAGDDVVGVRFECDSRRRARAPGRAASALPWLPRGPTASTPVTGNPFCRPARTCHMTLSLQRALDEAQQAPFVVDVLRSGDLLATAAAREGGPGSVRLLSSVMDGPDELTAVVHALARVFDDGADAVLTELCRSPRLSSASARAGP